MRKSTASCDRRTRDARDQSRRGRSPSEGACESAARTPPSGISDVMGQNGGGGVKALWFLERRDAPGALPDGRRSERATDDFRATGLRQRLNENDPRWGEALPEPIAAVAREVGRPCV